MLFVFFCVVVFGYFQTGNKLIFMKETSPVTVTSGN
jgi:hypothetical protein